MTAPRHLREKEALNAFEDKSLGFLERMKALKEWHRSQGGHYEFTLGPHTFNASSSRDVYYYVTDPEKGLGFRINSATLNQIPVK